KGLSTPSTVSAVRVSSNLVRTAPSKERGNRLTPTTRSTARLMTSPSLPRRELDRSVPPAASDTRRGARAVTTRPASEHSVLLRVHRRGGAPRTAPGVARWGTAGRGWGRGRGSGSSAAEGSWPQAAGVRTPLPPRPAGSGRAGAGAGGGGRPSS